MEIVAESKGIFKSEVPKLTRRIDRKVECAHIDLFVMFLPAPGEKRVSVCLVYTHIVGPLVVLRVKMCDRQRVISHRVLIIGEMQAIVLIESDFSNAEEASGAEGIDLTEVCLFS